MARYKDREAYVKGNLHAGGLIHDREWSDSGLFSIARLFLRLCYLWKDDNGHRKRESRDPERERERKRKRSEQMEIN